MYRFPKRPTPPDLKPRPDPVYAPKPGAVASTVAVVGTGRKNKGEVYHERHSEEPTNGAFDPLATDQAGVAFGVTIPGPEGSYASVRIDVWCSKACRPGMTKQAMADASEEVQERLAVESQEAREFLKTFGRR